MAQLAFKGLHYGAENIPDKAFESIPVVGPRYFKEKEDEARQKKKDEDEDRKMKDQGRDHRHIHRDRSPLDERRSSISSDDDNMYSQSAIPPGRSYRRSSTFARRQDYNDRGYDSDDGRGQPKPAYGQEPFFPPPPTRAVDDPPEGSTASRGYNPSEYPPPPSSQAGSNYYVPPPPPSDSPYLAAHNQPPPLSPDDPSRHSSVADRYRPSGYDERVSSPTARGAYSSSPNPQYPSAVAVRPPSYADSRDPRDYRDYNQDQVGYPTYDPPRDDSTTSSGRRRHRRDRDRDRDDDSDYDDSRSRRRSRSRGGSLRARSRSRAASVASKARDTFENHKKDIGASALGAIAGAFIGNELAKRNSKHGKHGKSSQPLNGKIGMIAGAAIGGIGANLIERRREQSQKKKKAMAGDDDGYDSY